MKAIIAIAIAFFTLAAQASTPKELYKENFALVQMAINLADSPVETRPVDVKRALMESDRDLAGAFMAAQIRKKGLGAINPVIEGQRLNSPNFSKDIANMVRTVLRDKQSVGDNLLFRQ